MGGTSLLFTSLSLGIILSVSRYSEGDMEATEKQAESVRANRPKPTH
jgi:hypothetical protein